MKDDRNSMFRDAHADRSTAEQVPDTPHTREAGDSPHAQRAPDAPDA